MTSDRNKDYSSSSYFLTCSVLYIFFVGIYFLAIFFPSRCLAGSEPCYLILRLQFDPRWEPGRTGRIVEDGSVMDRDLALPFGGEVRCICLHER